MTARSLRDQLEDATSPHQVTANGALAPLTTFRVGGAADWLVEVVSPGELVAVLRIARDEGLPLTVLGGGSNVLIADRGIRGIVVRPRLRTIRAAGEHRVYAEAGVTVNGLVRWTVSRGLAGLEEWSGTPGTIGGAVHGNAHFAGRNISDLIGEVGLVTRSGEEIRATTEEMAFTYGASRLRDTREILLWAELRVAPGGDVGALRSRARESLAYRKGTQPLALASAGCAFRNPDPARDRLPAGMPASAGALIDRAGLKGHRIGGASLSPVHGNFVVNDGTATAEDVRAVIESARDAVRERFGVVLRDEIIYLGQF